LRLRILYCLSIHVLLFYFRRIVDNIIIKIALPNLPRGGLCSDAYCLIHCQIRAYHQCLDAIHGAANDSCRRVDVRRWNLHMRSHTSTTSPFFQLHRQTLQPTCMFQSCLDKCDRSGCNLIYHNEHCSEQHITPSVNHLDTQNNAERSQK
jgi:hypothetical protein